MSQFTSALEKEEWKLQPKWLGSIDIVKFNTLPLWKKIIICTQLTQIRLKLAEFYMSFENKISQQRISAKYGH